MKTRTVRRMPPLTLDPQIPCFLLEASIDGLLHRGAPSKLLNFALQLHINDVMIHDPHQQGQKFVLDEPAAESIYVTFGGGDSLIHSLDCGFGAELFWL